MYRRKLLTNFYFNESHKQEIIKDMSKVNIYFKTTTVTCVDEQPTMLPFDLVSNIGGTLGLFVGMSLLSMCEIIQLLGDLVYSIFCGQERKKLIKVSVAKEDALHQRTVAVDSIESTSKMSRNYSKFNWSETCFPFRFR